MERARKHPELDDKGGYVPGTLTEDEAAAQGYTSWNSVFPAKELTPAGVRQDYEGSKRDLWSDPVHFPERFRGRAEQYATRGPDINEPAYTYPFRGTAVTPYRTEGDLIRAQRAVNPRRPQPTVGAGVSINLGPGRQISIDVGVPQRSLKHTRLPKKK